MSRNAKFGKYLLRTAGVLLAVFILFVIALWVWVANFDLQKHRTRIEEIASQTLGRDVHIDGPLSLKASLFPRVSVENVRIVNTDWAAQPDFLSVDQLQVEISLMSLLNKELVIQDIELNGATIHLQRGPDDSANWVFKIKTNQKSTSGTIPEIVGFQAKRVLVMLYPADRPPVAININEVRASLKHDEPVSISINSTISNLPLKIELQGGTLAEILDREARWPVKGTLDTDLRKIDFEGYVTDLVTFKDVKLRVSSEKQGQHESKLFGRSYEPMIDRYLCKLNISSSAGVYSVKLAGELDGFDLSRIYEAKQRPLKPSLKFKNLKFDFTGAGKTLSDIFQSAAADVEGTGIEFRYPIDTSGQQFYPARIDILNAKSTQKKTVELSIKGSANNVPVRVNVFLNRLLYGIWQSRDVPLDVQLQSSAAQARFAGSLSKVFENFKLDGKVSMQADNLKTVGNLFARSWPESAALQANSKVRFGDGALNISNILGQVGKQKMSGEVTLSHDDALNLSIKAHADHFDLHDAVQGDKLPAQFAFKLNGLNLMLQGKDQSLMQCVLAGAWEVSARQGQIGWRSEPADKKYLFSLHDISMTKRDNKPISLTALSLHNELKLKLDAQVGRFEDLLDPSQPYPLDAKLSGNDLSASFKGLLQKPIANIAVVGDLDIDGKISTIAQMTNIKLTQQQAASLHGHITFTRKDFKLTDVVATTSGVVVNGDVHYQTALSPNLVINATGSSIDLAPYLDIKIKPGNKAAKQTSRRSRIVPDAAFDLSKYRSLDAVVIFKDLGLKYQDTPIIMLNGRFTADNGLYRLDPFKIRSAIDGSTYLTRIELDSKNNTSRLKYSLHASNLDYGEILKRLEITDEISGTLDVQIDVNSEGNNLRSLLSNSNGEVVVVAGKGLVPKWLLEFWGSGLLRIMLPTTWLEEPVTDLNCAVGSFNLADGKMRSQTLLADTKRVTVAGEVEIDWRDEKIKGLLKPQPKESTLFHLGTPIQISGTLASPKFESAESGLVTLGKWAIGLTNPATIIILFGDIGAKEKNPCSALLKKNAELQEKAGHD